MRLGKPAYTWVRAELHALMREVFVAADRDRQRSREAHSEALEASYAARADAQEHVAAELLRILDGETRERWLKRHLAERTRGGR